MAADLELVLRWTKSRPLVLMGVDVRRGSEPWRPLLTKPIAENDGELTVPLGPQDPGRLTLKFAVIALAEIPRIAVYAGNGGAGDSKISPADAHEFKRLRRYDRWVQQARYDVTPSGLTPPGPRSPGALATALAFALMAAGSAAAQDELDARAATFAARLDDAVYATTTGPEAAHELFHEVDLSPYQLLSASLQFDRQKLVFTPGRLTERYVPVLSDTRLNVSQAYSIVTVGVGTSYTNAAPEGGRALAIARNVLEAAPERGAGEELEAYVERVGPLVVERFHERLATNAVVLTAAMNAQLFEVLGGTAVDEDADGRDDHAHRLRSWEVGAGVSWGITARAGLDAAYHYMRRRASAEEGDGLVPHHGASLSGTVRVATLDRDYRAYDAYQRALFVPSIVTGLGVEFLRCGGDAARCEDAVRDRWVFAPFVDFRLAQTNQLRVGMPIERRVEFGGGSEVELKPVFQVTIQLASP